jgi:hypothetical protein
LGANFYLFKHLMGSGKGLFCIPPRRQDRCKYP